MLVLPSWRCKLQLAPVQINASKHWSEQQRVGVYSLVNAAWPHLQESSPQLAPVQISVFQQALIWTAVIQAGDVTKASLVLLGDITSGPPPLAPSTRIFLSDPHRLINHTKQSMLCFDLYVSIASGVTRCGGLNRFQVWIHSSSSWLSSFLAQHG